MKFDKALNGETEEDNSGSDEQNYVGSSTPLHQKGRRMYVQVLNLAVSVEGQLVPQLPPQVVNLRDKEKGKIGEAPRALQDSRDPTKRQRSIGW